MWVEWIFYMEINDNANVYDMNILRGNKWQCQMSMVWIVYVEINYNANVYGMNIVRGIKGQSQKSKLRHRMSFHCKTKLILFIWNAKKIMFLRL